MLDIHICNVFDIFECYSACHVVYLTYFGCYVDCHIVYLTYLDVMLLVMSCVQHIWMLC